MSFDPFCLFPPTGRGTNNLGGGQGQWFAQNPIVVQASLLYNQTIVSRGGRHFHFITIL